MRITICRSSYSFSKALVVMFLIVAFVMPVQSQINLVPNPSFEDTIACPTAFGDINLSNFWSAYLNSPDYFNGCNGGIVGTPTNGAGYENAFDGQAYALIATYDNQQVWNYREYIGTQLTHSLNANVKYYVSFYYSRAYSVPGYITGATNNLGIRFTDQFYSASSNPMPIDNYSHGKISSISYDTTNWVRAFFTFQSDTSFDYLVIGNFYDNAHTDTADFHSNSAGYYIDAVCVSTDSLFATNWTSISQVNSNIFNIYVNSTNDKVIVKGGDETSFAIYSVNGSIVSNGILKSNWTEIDISLLANGIYLFKSHYNCRKFIVCR